MHKCVSLADAHFSLVHLPRRA